MKSHLQTCPFKEIETEMSIAVSTVEPAVPQFSRESEAFGSSFWRESVYVSSIPTILSYFWFILLMMRHCTAYGCSNRSNKVGCENLSWHKHSSEHRFCYMARAGTTEHLSMLFFGKMCLEVCFPVLFAWVHYFCCWSWKPLNCRLNCNNCYFIMCYICTLYQAIIYNFIITG